MNSASLLLTALVTVGITASALPADAGGQARTRTVKRVTKNKTSSRQRKPTQKVQRKVNRRLLDRQQEQAQRELKIVKNFLGARTQQRRKFAQFFEKVTVKRDYRGEYVMARDSSTTAFLDISDPQHPRYDPKKETGEETRMAHIPKHKRVHVLVVPNVKREHIGQSLGGSIGSGDLQTTLSVVKAAEKLAGQLKLKNAKVYINSEARIGVGYLHVHIVGERTSSTNFPTAMQ